MADNIPFLVLNQNSFAWTSLERLHRWPEVGSQTVYLYGPSGIGKSHLARQFVRDDRVLRPDLSWASLTAGQLAVESRECLESAERELAAQGAGADCSSAGAHASRRKHQARWVRTAVATNGATRAESRKEAWWQSATLPDEAFDELERKYRTLDLLVLEDLTELARLPRVQLQLVSIVDEILRRGGRVLWTSNRSPGELDGFTPRLLTRCLAGVCAALKPLAEASRFKLLCHLACAKQIPLPQETARWLAAELCVSPSELLGTLVRLDVAARERHSVLNCEFARRFLADEFKPRQLTLQEVTTTVARHFGVTVGALRSASRQRGLVVPRHCAMQLARELTELSLRGIAEFFGGRQHSTVLHGCQRLEELLGERPDLRHDLALIRRKLGVGHQPGERP